MHRQTLRANCSAALSKSLKDRGDQGDGVGTTLSVEVGELSVIDR